VISGEVTWVGRILTRILPGRDDYSTATAADAGNGAHPATAPHTHAQARAQAAAHAHTEELRRRIDELHDQLPDMYDDERAPLTLELMREAKRLCDELPAPVSNDADLLRLSRTIDRLAVELFRSRDREAGVVVARDLVRAARSATGTVTDLQRRAALSSGLQWLACRFSGAEDGGDELTTARDAVLERRYFYEESPELDRPGYATTLSRLAEVLAERGRYAEAVAPLREAVTQFRIVVVTAAKPRTHFDPLVRCATRLGKLSVLLEDRELGLAAAQEAVAAAREAAEHDPDVYERWLYRPLVALLDLQNATRPPLDLPAPECLETAGEIVRVLRGTLARGPSNATRKQLALWLCDFSKFADLRGNRGEAISTAREAEAILRALPDADTEPVRNQLAQVRMRLAFIYLRMNRVDESRAAHDDARALYLSASVPDFTQLGRLMGLDVLLLARRGEAAAAIAACREQIDFLNTAEAGAPTHYVVLYQHAAWRVLARLLAADGQAGQSADALEQAGIYRLRLQSVTDSDEA
jgi:tetratricopeptide (TPR) repeat protein